MRTSVQLVDSLRLRVAANQGALVRRQVATKNISSTLQKIPRTT
jgi:hypothetical protein